MPIYEYGCPDCGNQFEALQKFSDDPVRECPACKAMNVKKKISATSFVLKGSGWYKDHYGLKSGGSSESGGAASTSGTPAASSTGSAPAASAPASSAPAAAAPSAPSAPAPSAPAK